LIKHAIGALNPNISDRRLWIHIDTLQVSSAVSFRNVKHLFDRAALWHKSGTGGTAYNGRDRYSVCDDNVRCRYSGGYSPKEISA
jgi:hypothetical protein